MLPRRLRRYWSFPVLLPLAQTAPLAVAADFLPLSRAEDGVLHLLGEIPEGKGYGDYLNTDSVTVIHNAMIEPSLVSARPEDKFQFVRTGYFVKDMKYPNTYNRIVGLKDSFPKESK